MKSKSKKSKSKRPLTISIHGDGIDIDAKFSDAELGHVIAETVRKVSKVTTPPIVMGTAPAASNDVPTPSDWDFVTHVIGRAPVPMLQEIMKLASRALEQRAAAS